MLSCKSIVTLSVPILRKVADYGMELLREPVRGGSEIRQYVLNFVDEAARVVLKPFINANGGISLSDAGRCPINKVILR